MRKRIYYQQQARECNCLVAFCWHNSHTLLLSKKLPTTDPANYRPIGIQNCMYKLYSRVVTDILYSYVEEAGILTPWQEGFRRDRNCGRQLRFLKRVMEDAQLNHLDLHLLSVDFKSAFNSVDQNCLHHIMHQLGVPRDAVEVVAGIYAGTTTKITCPAGTTRSVPVRRGTIQGDVLSPLLFLLALEPLLRWVAEDTVVGVHLTTTPSLYQLERTRTISISWPETCTT